MLHSALRGGTDLEMAKWIIKELQPQESKAFIDARNVSGETALLVALKFQPVKLNLDLEIVIYDLINRFHADVTVCDETGLSPATIIKTRPSLDADPKRPRLSAA